MELICLIVTIHMPCAKNYCESYPCQLIKGFHSSSVVLLSQQKPTAAEEGNMLVRWHLGVGLYLASATVVAER